MAGTTSGAMFRSGYSGTRSFGALRPQVADHNSVNGVGGRDKTPRAIVL